MLSPFGKVIHRVQVEKGLSEGELAAKAGMTRQNLYRAKRATRPHIKTIHVIAKALGEPVDIFLKDVA